MKRVIGGKLFYSRHGLIKNIGISTSSIADWSTDKIECDGGTYLHYNGIPVQSRKRIDEYENDWRLAYLADGYESDYVKHIPACREVNSRENIFMKNARNVGLWERILALTDESNPERVSIARIHETYLKLNLPNKHFTIYYAFYKKLMDCRKLIKSGKSLVDAIVDGNTGNKNAQKLTSEHKRLIEDYYSKSNVFTKAAIAEKVNKDLKEKGLESISYASVKKYLQNQDVKNRHCLTRYGSKEYNDTQKAYIPFNKPEFTYELAEMDGVRLPFWCWNKAGTDKVRPTLFPIIDVHSGKITGWSLDNSEARWVVFQALKSQAKTGYLPKTIFTDNFSAKTTNELTDLFDKLKQRGTEIKYCRVGNAQGKPHIERFFGTFQDRFCREYPDWLGMDIKSKKRDNHPNPDALQIQLKKQPCPTFEEMRQRVETMLDCYNNTSFDGKLTPNQKFELSPKTKAIPVSEGELPYLFWHQTESKVNRGFLTIEVNKVAYRYEIGIDFNHKTVLVRYEPEDLSEVYVFPVANDSTTYQVLSQHLGFSRSDLKSIGETDRRNKQSKADREKQLAEVAPHLVSKAASQQAEDDLFEEAFSLSPADKGMYWKPFVPGAKLPVSNMDDDE